jgi:hypothetical protein
MNLLEVKVTTRFDKDSVYDVKPWLAIYPEGNGYSEKYLNICKEKLDKLNYPGIEYEIEEFKSGGIFFNTEKTQMLGVSMKKSQFEKLGIYFRSQEYGNAVYYSLLKTIDKGLFDAQDNNVMVRRISRRLKNQAQRDEFNALSYLGELIFIDVMKDIDPKFDENLFLFQSSFS